MKNKLNIFFLSLFIAGCGGGGSTQDVVIPPATPTTDLFFGYYLTMSGQVKETRAHVNLIFESGFDGGREGMMDNLALAQLPAIVDVSQEMYLPPGSDGKHLNPQAETNLRALFQRMADRDLLKYVIALYPIDEPDTTVIQASDVHAGNLLVRKVAAEFPGLFEVKLAVILAHADTPLLVEDYDWIGLDNYDMGSSILTNGYYQKLVNRLTFGQRIILVPAGSDNWRQDPTPFINFANSHPEVAAVIAFTWGNHPNMPGIRDNGMAAVYRAAGLSIKQAYCCPVDGGLAWFLKLHSIL